MHLIDLYLKRESCRNFNGQPVDKQLILEILNESRLTPSARNSQPWHFWLIDDVAVRQHITSDLSAFTQQAGGMVIITTEDRVFIPAYKKHDYQSFDVGSVSSHIILSAANKQLSTCLIGSFDDEHVKHHIPSLKDQKIHIIILFGYTDDLPREKERQPLENILTIV